MRDLLRRWFGIRCFVLWCPGEVVITQGGDVFWRCTRCGGQTEPRGGSGAPEL